MNRFAALLLFLGSFISAPIAAMAQVATEGVAVATSAAVAAAPGYMDGTYIADPTMWDKFVQTAPNWLVALVPMLVAAMVVFRALAEGMLAISRVLGEKEHLSKAAAIVLQVADALGRILGQVGVGMPKQLVLERAEKIAAKEEAKAAAAPVKADGQAS